MKFSFRQLLLLVALATTTVFAKGKDVETVALQGNVAVVQHGKPAETVALQGDITLQTKEVAPAAAKSELSLEGDSRFIRTTNKILRYIIKNRAFVVKRLTRDILHKLISDSLKKPLKKQFSPDGKDKAFSFNTTEKRNFFGPRSNVINGFAEGKDGTFTYQDVTGEYLPQGEAGDSFRDLTIDNIIKTTIIAGLDISIKTEEEHWALSMACAAFFEYFVKGGDIWDAAREGVEDYLTSVDCAQHLGKYSWAWYAIPYFIGSLKKREFTFDPATGLSYNLSGLLAFNPKTRVPSLFAKDSFGDSFVKNLIGRALIPGFLGFLTKNHNPSYGFKDLKGKDSNGNDTKFNVFATVKEVTPAAA